MRKDSDQQITELIKGVLTPDVLKTCEGAVRGLRPCAGEIEKKVVKRNN